MVLLCFRLNLKICRLGVDGLRHAAGDPEILRDLVEQLAERKDFPPYAGLAMLIACRLDTGAPADMAARSGKRAAACNKTARSPLLPISIIADGVGLDLNQLNKSQKDNRSRDVNPILKTYNPWR
jgi:hypothetical protein